jgi:hypothetical protein
MLILRYLLLSARYNWSLSNLVAMLRHQLFAYRDLFTWLHDPFPPDKPDPQFSLPQFG